MAAIVTDNLKKQLLDTIITEVEDSATYYYIGIGRSNPWDETDTVPSVYSTEREKRNYRTALQSVIRTTESSFVIPRYNWTSGSIYTSYNDNLTAANNATTYPFYVLTANQRVYICMQQGKSDNGTVLTSTVDPDTVGAITIPSATADGYIWKYLFTLSGTRASSFLSANYLPISSIDSAESYTVIEQAQKNVQDAAITGSIVGYRVVSAGAGYSSTPTVTIVGDGSGATAIAKRTETNSISKIEINDSVGGIPIGSGYSYATAVLSGGSPSTAAVIEPIISLNGLGADPREDLGADAVMFNAKPAGTQNGSFMVDQDFRQIGLIKGPKAPSGADFTSTDGRGMRIITLDNITAGFDSAAVKDAIITGNTSTSVAIADELKGTTLYYHFDDETGFRQFTAGEDIYLDSGTGITATITTDSAGEVDLFSGEILYIENRSAVVRDAAQTEDIKIIVKL